MNNESFSLADLIVAEHILVGIKTRNDLAAIRRLGRPLVKDGCVRPEFVEAVCQRERNYPTGLPTEPVATAIPHADPTHVERSAVSLGILAQAVPFAQMGGDGSVKVQVQVVFLLAIKQREKQVDMLHELVNLIQDQVVLARLVKASSPRAVLEILKPGG